MEAGAIPVGQAEHRHLRVLLPGGVLHPLIVKVEIILQVVLVHHQCLGGGEHQGVFLHLVVPLGDGEEGHPEALADVELRRAHQVADVLHENDVQVVQIELGEHLFNAHGLDVAGPVGVDLGDRNAHGVDGVGVNLSGDVPFNDPDAVALPQGVDEGYNGAGLACTGGAHDVDQAHLVLGQRCLHGVADVLVPVHYLMQIQ